ncbi:MAG: zinc ribbon domain-containing protein [Gemmatimonadales bacterium]|nr:zinc ribbon domain-containing protein [Gemmatimonadales bacterium]
MAYCPRCGAAASDRFCGKCGAELLGGPAPVSRPGIIAPLAVAGVALVVLLIVLVVPRGPSSGGAPPVGADAVAPGEGTPPDLSTMSPRERFDRLYNRVMRAAEAGDAPTMTQFSPMAFQAYQQLDTVDADAQYHAAVLFLHVRSDSRSALALADSILRTSPGHLLGILIQGTAAGMTGDSAALRRSSRAFLGAWDKELAADRPEYRDHRVMLDQFRAGALARVPKS